MNRYLVVFEKTSTGFSAYAPDLPGCIATGKTKASTEKLIYESIQFHIEGLKLEKLSVPKGKAESEVLVFS